MILRRILNDDLYTLTHPDHKDEVARNFAEIMYVFPDEPVDPGRVTVETRRCKMKYDIRE